MSKKNILYLSLGIAIILICGVWLFLNKKSNLPKYIPADAIGVVKINPMAIGRKLDMTEIKNMKSYDDMMDELNDGGVEMSEMFENPDKTGISLMDNIYFFMDKDDREVNAGMLIAVSDPTKLRDFLEKFAKKNRLKYKENGDFYMYVAKEDDEYNRLSILWNNDVCLFYSAEENSMGAAKKILNQSKEQSIFSSESFNESENKGGDISLYLNNKSLEDVIETELEREDMDEFFPEKLKEYVKNVDGSSFILSLNDDNIGLEGIQFFKDEKKADEFNLLNESGISEEGLNFISSNGNVLLGLSTVLNMEEILKILKSIPNYDEMQDEIESSVGLSERDLENLLNGSISFSINDIKIKEVEKLVYNYDNYNYELGEYEYSYQMVPQPVPTYSVQIGLKDPKVFKKLISKLKEIGGDRVNQDGALLTIATNSEFGDLNIVQVNDFAVITNDQSAAKDLKSNGKWNSTLNAEVSSLFRDNPVAAYWNMDLASYGGDKKLKTILGVNEYETQEYRLMKKVMNNFKSLTVSSDLKRSKINLNMNSGNGNSLMKIIRIIDEVASEEKRKH